MISDAVRSHCDVLGCHRPATDAYLHAIYARLVESGTCTDHDCRLMKGVTPVFVEERFDLGGPGDRPVLVVRPPPEDAGRRNGGLSEGRPGTPTGRAPRPLPAQTGRGRR